MRVRRITVDDQIYAVRDGGDGSPLLALHGFTGSGATWLPLAEQLGAGRRLLALDLLGHGASSTPRAPTRYGSDRLLADLGALLDQLETPRVDLLGYSMGGRIALAFALAHPTRVRRLLLESTSPGLTLDAERAARRADDERWARLLEAQGLAAFVAAWERLPLWQSQARLPPAMRHALRRQRLAQDPLALAACLRGIGAGAQPACWARLGAIDCPVALITGALDTRYVGLAKRMQALLPRATLHVVPETGHAVHLEQPPVFADIVARFLALPPGR